MRRIHCWCISIQSSIPEGIAALIANLLSHIGHNHTGHGL